MTWSPDHTFAVESGGTPPPDVVTAATIASEGSPPPPLRPGPRVGPFLVGGAVVAVGGVAAFLAATIGGHADGHARSERTAVPGRGRVGRRLGGAGVGRRRRRSRPGRSTSPTGTPTST